MNAARCSAFARYDHDLDVTVRFPKLPEGSTDPGETLTVNTRATTSTVVSFSPNPVVVGQASTVTVTVTDTSAATATATKQVTVSAPVGPSASLALTPSTGAIPLAVTANASGSTAGSAPITSYTFDFGDGSAVVGPQAGTTANHTYTAVGTFTVTLTVKDANGLTSTATRQVVAQSTPPPPSISYIGRVGSAALVASTTSVTVPVSAATHACDSLVVSVMRTGTSPGTVTVTDTKSDVYAVTADVTDASKHRTLVVTAFTAAALGTSDTVTLTYPSSSKYNVSVDEFAGLSAVDQVKTASGASGGTTFATPAATTTTPNELLVCAVGSNSGTQPTFDAGWTALPSVALSSYRITSAYRIVTASGSYACSGATTSQWAAGLATYR